MCRIITAAVSGDELLLKLRPKYEQEPKKLKSFQKQCKSVSFEILQTTGACEYNKSIEKSDMVEEMCTYCMTVKVCLWPESSTVVLPVDVNCS